MTEIIKDNVKVSLHTDTNEGWNGDYNPDDPDDDLLYRFDVDVLINNVWEPVDDASYCTALKASSVYTDKALSYLMSEIYPAINSGASIKKLCERLSWISDSTFT